MNARIGFLSQALPESKICLIHIAIEYSSSLHLYVLNYYPIFVLYFQNNTIYYDVTLGYYYILRLIKNTDLNKFNLFISMKIKYIFKLLSTSCMLLTINIVLMAF